MSDITTSITGYSCPAEAFDAGTFAIDDASSPGHLRYVASRVAATVCAGHGKAARLRELAARLEARAAELEEQQKTAPAKLLTSSEAADALRRGHAIRMAVGTDPEDPVLIVRNEDGSAVSESIGGWSAGVVEPVCSLDSDFLEKVYLRGLLTLAPTNDPEWVVEIVDNVTTKDGHEIGRVHAATHHDATERAARMVGHGQTFRIRSPEIAQKTNNVWELSETYAMRVGERHEWVHEPATVLVDLVADVMHLADLRGVSAESVLADAHDHYAADLAEYAQTHPGDVPFA